MLVAILWAAVAAAQLVLAFVHLRAAEGAAADVRRSVDADALRSGELRSDLDGARDRLRRAHGLLNGPVLAPVRIVPYAGRQVRAVAAMAGAAEGAAEAGLEPLDEARRLVEENPRRDAARLEAVERVAAALERAHRKVEALDLGPRRALLPPVARRHDRLSSDLVELRQRLADASTISRGFAELLGGPRRYLLFAANNAEMRAGSGMFLSAGEITFAGGGMTIGPVEPTAELTLDPDDAPPITGDLGAQWGWLEPNRDFRNLAVTPRFDEWAQLAAQMWHARTGDRVDGVLAVDAAALTAVLRAGGAVTVDDTVITPGDAVDFVLHDQYDVMGTVTATQQAHRRDSLGRLAAAAFERVAGGDAELVTLVEGLAEAANGRHLLAWARHPAEQAAWSAAGVDGAVTEDSLAVSLLNRGGNKLDYFLRMECELEAFPTAGVRELTVRVVMRNQVGAGEVPYVRGPHPDVDAEAGEYVGLLAVTLPADARRSRFEGSLPLAVSGADGPTRVIATEVRIPAGATREVVLRTEVSAVRTHVRLEPSARIPAVRWHVGDDRFTDRERREIVLD